MWIRILNFKDERINGKMKYVAMLFLTGLAGIQLERKYIRDIYPHARKCGIA
jgi:hypothetical protein